MLENKARPKKSCQVCQGNVLHLETVFVNLPSPKDCHPISLELRSDFEDCVLECIVGAYSLMSQIAMLDPVIQWILESTPEIRSMTFSFGYERFQVFD